MVTVHFESPHNNHTESAYYVYSHSARSALLLAGFLPVEGLEDLWKNPFTGVIAHFTIGK